MIHNFKYFFIAICFIVASSAATYGLEYYYNTHGDIEVQLEQVIPSAAHARILNNLNCVESITNNSIGSIVTLDGQSRDIDRCIRILNRLDMYQCMPDSEGNVYYITITTNGTLSSSRNDARCLR